MRPFLFEVAQDLKRRFGEDISKIAVVFNNKRPATYLKKFLAVVYGKTFMMPSFFTIREFMALSSQKAVANEISRFFILLESYNQLLREEGKDPENPEDFYHLSQTILSDFEQINYEMVDPRPLYTYLKDIGELKQTFSDFTSEQQAFISDFWSSFSAEKQTEIQQKFIELWERLPKLFFLYQQKLSDSGLTSTSVVYRRLAEGKADNPSFTESFEKVVFVGFNALNNSEATLFQKWQQEQKALFYFDADTYYLNDKIQEAGLFLRRNLQQYHLENAMGPFPEVLNAKEKELNIYPMPGFTAQAKALYPLLKDALDRVSSPGKIGIILADEHLIIPVLQSVPDDININITMGYPVRQSSAFQLLSGWLAIQKQLQQNPDTALSESVLRQFLDMELLEFPAEEKNTALKKYRETDSGTLLDFLQGRYEAAGLFFSRQEKITDCFDVMKELIRLVLRQREQQQDLPQIEGHLLTQAFITLNRLNDNLADFQGLTDIPLALTLIARVLSGMVAPMEGAPMEGVQIMGMLESRCLDFEEVFILGANEGILPYSGVSNSFIPDSLRRAFGLPKQEDQEALSAYLFYRLIQKSMKIHILYNSRVDHNTTGEITRFVSQLGFESNCTIREHSLTVAPHEFSAGIGSLVVEKTEKILQTMERYTAGGDRYFSASALKTYLDCPLRFFLEHLAELRQPDETVQPYDAWVLGNVFHRVMQQFYRPFLMTGEAVTREKIRERRKVLRTLCKAALKEEIKRPEYLDGHPDSRLAIAEEIALANAELIVDHDLKEVTPFRIIGLEKEYRTSLPLNFRNGETKHVNFKAFIDRIDETEGQVRIVDYKTGKDAVTIKNGLESIFSHKSETGNPAAFQTLLYAAIYQKMEGIIPRVSIYGLRTMAEEGTELILKESRKPGVKLETSRILPEYLEGLGLLVGEIYDPGIPFRHNEDAKYCQGSPYAVFCGPGEDEEQPFED